jgi:hypothetical protein
VAFASTLNWGKSRGPAAIDPVAWFLVVEYLRPRREQLRPSPDPAQLAQ